MVELYTYKAASLVKPYSVLLEKHSELHAEKDALQTDRDTLQAEHDKLVEDNKNLTISAAASTASLEQYQADMKLISDSFGLQAEKEAIINFVKGKLSSLSELERNNAALNQQVQKLETDVKNLQADYDNSQSVLENAAKIAFNNAVSQIKHFNPDATLNTDQLDCFGYVLGDTFFPSATETETTNDAPPPGIR
ncbi:uncharacterized protein LOC133317224 [Gastrolobium bilobum]|uniref:uncharacterized protein LOC133317224 n=1 Tax=Gastrolobium bilobum TaxID=150636 RepID=UPI002AAFA644|nr:uncharacterized protein LOC133317224 [Gastrolobium bilobum]